jgi:hypothetical protein
MSEKEKPARPRNIANDILDAVETATSKWTRQKKSEERHPGNIRYRASRMTREPRTTQKEAAWEVMEQAYMAASGNGTLPASARQIFYQARPKIMAMTEDKELAYGYFSQTLLPTSAGFLIPKPPLRNFSRCRPPSPWTGRRHQRCSGCRRTSDAPALARFPCVAPLRSRASRPAGAASLLQNRSGRHRRNDA